jgi:hypothetical protein
MIRRVPVKEKFTISVTDTSVVIRNHEDISMEFSAAEALMLLDILSNEASTLRRMADEASPLPIRLRTMRPEG